MFKITLALLICSLSIGAASAQVRNSIITGTVSDQSSAVVPKATITVTNQLTNESVTTTSGPTGDYAVPYLAAGHYTVSIDASGFRTYRVDDVALGTALTVRVDAKLAIGATNQVVTIEATTAQLQTENSTVSGSIDAEVIKNVPNITDNPLYYATLSAGVVPAALLYDSKNLGIGFYGHQVYSAIRINGGMLGLDDVQLDGVPVQGSGWHESTVLPNRDALQEVTVSTNNLSADLGGGQGIIQMVTKSGTNAFHGDVFYTLRNEMFNANGLANNMQGISRGKFRVNEGGGSVGGPVILPKLFSGKDKVFFFGAFDRITHQDPFSGLTTVPTDLQRQGDYSQTLIPDQSGNPVPVRIFNPFTATLVPGSSQVYVRQEYANAIVTDPDPYGLKYLQAYPEPNHTATDVFGNNNYLYSGTQPSVRNTLNTRLDVHLGKNALYASGGVELASTRGVNLWGPSSPWSNMSSPNYDDDNPYISVGDIITVNPTAFVDFHVGVQRVNAIASYPTGNFDPSQYSAYGMPTAIQNLIGIPGVAPSTWTFGYGNAPLNWGMWSWKNEHQTNWDFNGSFTKVVGRWTLKQGADWRVYLSNWADRQLATPSLAAGSTECYCEQYANIDGGQNGSYDITPQQNGFAGAQAAIGVMGYRLDPGTTTMPALADKVLSFFTQNDWKVTNRLTLNLGLRYELQPGPTERHDREYDLDLTAVNPFANGISVANANPKASLGKLAFAGQDGYSRHLWDTEYNNVSLRLGAAYRLTNQVAVHGGYGRIYAPSNTGFNANAMVYGAGAFAGGAVSTPYGISQNGLPAGRFESGLTSELIPAPGPVQSPSLYGSPNSSASVDFFDRKGYRNAYMDQWNVLIERSFHGWLASAGYVGSRGVNLGWRNYPLNGAWAIPRTDLTNWRDEWLNTSGAHDPAQDQIPNPMPAMVGKAIGSTGNTNISVMQSEMPYLGLLNQTIYKSAGSSNYNAFELQLRHAYSSGLTAQFHYVWSRVTGISGGVNNSTYAESQRGDLGWSGQANYADLKSNKGLLGFDVPNRFVGVVTYLLPWGSGGKYELSNPVARKLAGGWQLGTVVNLQEGQPWGPYCGGSLNGRCIPTGQPLEVPKNLQHWYDGSTTVTLPDGRSVTPSQYRFLKWNPDAFTSQIVQFPNGNYSTDQYWYGTTPIFSGSLREPGFKNVNFNLTREFSIRERLKLEILAEATNLLNHTNFNPGSEEGYFGSPIMVPDPSTNSTVGENGDNNAGTLSLNLMDPREVTFTARITF